MNHGAMTLFLLGLVACGADPQPPSAESATQKTSSRPVATATAKASATASAATAVRPGTLDPMTLLEGKSALDALPTRATTDDKPLDPALRVRLMAPPP